MTKMTKYQLEHFENKVKRYFQPLIDEQHLLIKQYRTEATNNVVKKLAKKMGADKILQQMKEAEEFMKEAQNNAKTFFEKQSKKEKDKHTGGVQAGPPKPPTPPPGPPPLAHAVGGTSAALAMPLDTAPVVAKWGAGQFQSLGGGGKWHGKWHAIPLHLPHAPHLPSHPQK